MNESRIELNTISDTPSQLIRLLVIAAVQETKLFTVAQTDEIVTDVAISLENQISLLPKSLKAAVSIALKLFNLESLITHRKTFRGQSQTARIDHFLRWERSRLAAKRDFIRFIRSMALFNFYDHPDVRTRI